MGKEGSIYILSTEAPTFLLSSSIRWVKFKQKGNPNISAITNSRTKKTMERATGHRVMPLITQHAAQLTDTIKNYLKR
jgi:hypothetical protein